MQNFSLIQTTFTCTLVTKLLEAKILPIKLEPTLFINYSLCIYKLNHFIYKMTCFAAYFQNETAIVMK